MSVTYFYKNVEVVVIAEGQLSCATIIVLETVQSETMTSEMRTVIRIGGNEVWFAPNLPSILVVAQFGEFVEQVIHYGRTPHLDLIVNVLERR